MTRQAYHLQTYKRQLPLVAELIRAQDGDEELLVKMIQAFQEHYPKLLSTIQSAVLTKNGEDLALAAHTLKGSLCIFNIFPTLVDHIATLEAMGLKNDLSGAEEVLLKLEEDLECLLNVFLQFLHRNDVTKI